MTVYTYGALGDGHIRLLRLLPAAESTAALEGNLIVRKLRVSDRLTESEPTITFNDDGVLSFVQHEAQQPISAELEQTGAGAGEVSSELQIQEAESYEALSYTWGGKPDSSHFIRILEGGQAYNIPITQNLESALRHLRPSSDATYLWVDALCINQVNHAEKGSQIPKMADIYNQATKVRVWLGEANDNSDIALKFIRRVINLSDLDELVQNPEISGEWAAFLDLMKRPLFSRRWVVQEIALARDACLHCGTESVTWREFAEAVSLCTSKHHDVRKLFKGSQSFDHHPDFLGEIEELGANRLVYASSNLFRKSDDGTIMEHLLSLEALMSSLSVFEAENPHDVVYAILWLANDATPSTERAIGSSLSEHWVIHTPTPGSPTPYAESPTRASSPASDRRTLQTPNDSAVQSADTTGHSETHSPIDHTNQYLQAQTLSVPNYGQKGHKRTASDLTLPPPKIRLQMPVDRKITVDYSKSVYEVCKDFLAFVMAQSESLDIICRPWAPEPVHEKEQDLPSWIPKLSSAPFELVDKVYKRVEADALVGLPGMRRKNYLASGKRKAIWRFKESVDRSLFVCGFILDKVNVRSETAQQGIIPAEWLKVVQWDPGRAAAPDRFWRTLVADRGPDGSPPPHIYQSALNYAFQRKGQRGDLNTRELILFGKCPSMAIDFLRRVQSVVWKRSLISTSREHFLGLAPSKAREGDLICILYGCSVPVVLRRKHRTASEDIPIYPTTGTATNEDIVPRVRSNKRDHYYEFIGECYIHGMMDGEALRHQRIRELQQQEFELR
ncbi:hypothetical protein EPUS_05253 [Endocarpon pusillum Z07020]|uniref:Heterokaryon incompatibility domain-containing protein n=1 Tax=Endocarpon pusillum (strain Z07020 / HMAS-L-300199) TaxID=1263415 RepID=U1FTU5_ENDPU|nr:uncharacterized protein EPUS_05253 [Endocarpon pusillum Z07020]ERF68172.1 hypothetical protein EPUS_05253 [Endocarpon pusillum Z07020]